MNDGERIVAAHEFGGASRLGSEEAQLRELRVNMGRATGLLGVMLVAFVFDRCHRHVR